MLNITSTKEELQERIKELSCYEISSVIRNHQKDITEALVQVLEILTRSWRFSEKAIGELKFGNMTFARKSFRKILYGRDPKSRF